MLYFFLTCGHFFQTAAVYYVYVLGAQTLSAARRVHCNVAAADNRNACVLLDRSVTLRLVCLHEVNSGEELVSGVNALEVLAGDIHESRQTCAGTDEYSLEALLEQLVDFDGASYNDVGVYLNAHSDEVVYLVLNDGLRQSELGDTVNENAACEVERFENSNVIAELSEVARACQTGRTCADDGYLVTIRSGNSGSLCCVRIVPVGNESLKTADSYRLALDAAYALALALGLLGTYASADSRQGAGLVDNLISALKIALLNLCDEFRNVDGNRAAALAGLLGAVQAAVCLVDSLLLGVAKSYFLEVLVADVRVLNGHFVLLKAHVRHLTLPPFCRGCRPLRAFWSRIPCTSYRAP